MCAGAIIHARVQRVIFGAWDQKAGAVRSVYDLISNPKLNHAPAGVGGGPVLCAAWCLQPRAWVVPWVGWLPGHGVETLQATTESALGQVGTSAPHGITHSPWRRRVPIVRLRGAERRAHRPHGHGPLAPSRSVTCPLLRPSTCHAQVVERVTTCSCTHRHGKSVLVLQFCRRDHARRCLCVPAVALRRLCRCRGVTPTPIDFRDAM